MSGLPAEEVAAVSASHRPRYSIHRQPKTESALAIAPLAILAAKFDLHIVR